MGIEGTVMKNRLANIIYLLSSSETPLTSEEISKRLGVSSRTVKADMTDVRGELGKVGAGLVAKRNKGYAIRIDDKALYQPFLEQISVKGDRVDNLELDDMSKFLYVARKLVSSPGYVKMGNIAGELYTSRSALRDSIKRALEFLGSYGLTITSKPGHGIRILGNEQHIRLAMTELYANHFHMSRLEDSDPEYAKWMRCGEKERQDIRHIFLRTIVPSGFSILDLYSQRLSHYLIIARNRFHAGHPLLVETKAVEEIQQYREYRIASDIYGNLRKKIPGYDLSEQETAFLAILLLGTRDMGHIAARKECFPTLYDEAGKCAGALFAYVRERIGIDLGLSPRIFEELRSTLIPILAKIRFHISGGKVISSPIKSEIDESPVALEIGRVMAAYLQRSFGCPAADYNTIHQFTCLAYKVLYYVPYDIRKRKLLTVNTDGINYGKIMEHRLRTYFPNLIESCKAVELYEIRGMDQSRYDGVLMNTVKYSYKYDLPHASLDTASHANGLNQVYDAILIQAYQFRHLLPDPSVLHVYEDFEYQSKEQFIQLISFKHCSDSDRQKAMESGLLHHEGMISYRTSRQTVFLFGDPKLTDDESVEVYFLKNENIWSGEKIQTIVYTCLEWHGSIQRLKAMENCLCQLSLNPAFFRFFREDKATALEKLVLESLRLP